MKKKILTVFAMALSTIGAMAQVDFTFDEEWVAPPFANAENPLGWTGFNVLTTSFVGMPQTVFQETANPYSGTAAVKIVTEVIPNPYRPGQNFDTVGVLIIGDITMASPISVQYGDSLIPSTRPAQLSFACKYTPQAGDSAFVLAYLTHFNGVKRDTIASGKYATGVTTANYSIQNVTMNYDPNPAFNTVLADSQFVLVSASIYSHAGAKKGSTLWVDQMAWSGYVSINDIGNVKNTVSVFPNPAADNIIITSSMNAKAVEVMDVTGRLIDTYSMQNNKADLQTTGFSPGMYFYTILSDTNEIMNRGKFEIVR